MELSRGGRVFASHYQILICDDPHDHLPADMAWDDAAVQQGFAGGGRVLAVGTEADRNDHWVEVVCQTAPPDLSPWQRVTVAPFTSLTGRLHVMSVTDSEPAVSLALGPGDYSVYIAGQNLGIDLDTRGEPEPLPDHELATRRDLEWYRIYVVPGLPASTGRLKDA